MPFQHLQDLDLYYESHGEGPELLLISGLGGGTWTWYGQLPFFSRSYRTIVFDNRGAGRSGAPPGPYTMRQLAEDTLALLDGLDIGRTFVLALSMGGMIALELALLAPGRVRALVLGCTHAGGANRIPPSQEVIATLVNVSGLTHEEIMRRNLPIFFSRTFLDGSPQAVEEYCRIQLENPLQPEHALMAQLAAIASFDQTAHLAEIKAPALVVTGTADVLVSPENSRCLARRLPNAQLVEIAGAAHALHVERRDELNLLGGRFFTEHARESVS